MSTRFTLALAPPNSQLMTCLTLVCLLVVSGCSSETPESAATAVASHDHKSEASHPKTYEEAVAAVSAVHQAIKDAFAANDEDAAHGPLHTIGHALEDVGSLIEEADLTKEQQKSVKAAVESLFEEYGAVDATMHGNEGKTYDEASAQIDASLEVLKGVIETEADPATEAEEGETDE